jgi:uncharacterized heparinase superfamily protein
MKAERILIKYGDILKASKNMRIYKYIVRLYNTIKYMKCKQLFYWIYKNIKHRIYNIGCKTNHNINVVNISRKIVGFKDNLKSNKFSNVIDGEYFTFLNRTEKLGFPPVWNKNNLSQLWLLNLHYFDYIEEVQKNKIIELYLDWIKFNTMQINRETAWHPYAISKRSINWINCGVFKDSLLKSLYKQVCYLYRFIEYDLPANHLLENAKALIIAGLFFNGEGESKKWLQKGLKILKKACFEQINNDGGYFEPSPMYHSIVLECYLDIIKVIPKDYNERNLFIATASRMLDYLNSVIHPDGNIPLFSDSAFEISRHPSELNRYATNLFGYIQNTNICFPSTGYYIYRDKNIYINIDAGKIGPDHIPGHGHADIFTYELSIHDRRFIVDSGVYEYEAGEMREYTRSSKAHNTVTINRINQAELWGSFRVARRYKPHNVIFKKESYGVSFSGSFGGYANIIGYGIIHNRKIYCNKKDRTITIVDTVDGDGRHVVESYVHLNPDLGVEVMNNIVRLSYNGIVCFIDTINTKYSISQGWYSPRFGQRYRNKVIVFGGYLELPTQLEYKIRY